MAKSKLVEVNEKIAENVVGGYKKIEEGVVGGYKKIEDGVVGGFNKIADKFVDSFLTKEGESVEEARERLAAEQKARIQTGCYYGSDWSSCAADYGICMEKNGKQRTD